MGKHYSIELKNEIVTKYESGNYSLKLLEKEYDISNKTIFNWIRKQKKQGNQINDINKSRGRKSEVDIDYKERYEILKKYQAFLKAQREKK